MVITLATWGDTVSLSVKTQADTQTNESSKWMNDEIWVITIIRNNLSPHETLSWKTKTDHQNKQKNNPQKTNNSNTGLVFFLERCLSWCEMKECTKRFSVFLKSDETKWKVKERKNIPWNKDCALTDGSHKILTLLFLSLRQFSGCCFHMYALEAKHKGC